MNIFKQLSTDTCRIDFGTTVIGETLKRTFILTNKGALGTKFEFFKVTGQKERTVTTAATSLGGLVSCREEIKGETKHKKLTLNIKDLVPLCQYSWRLLVLTCKYVPGKQSKFHDCRKLQLKKFKQCTSIF